MIGIRVNATGTYLDVLPDTKITLTLVNPIFADGGIIPGSYSIPFALPVGAASPTNDRELNHPMYVSSVSKSKEIAVTLYISGVPFKRGTLVVREGTGNTVAAHFKFGIATLGEEFKNSRIKDVISETITLDNTAITKKVFIKPSGLATTPYQIVINGITYSENTLTDLVNSINAQTDFSKRATATLITSGNTPNGLTPNYIEIKPYGTHTILTPLSVQPVENTLAEIVKWETESFDVDDYYDPIQTALDSFYSATPAHNKFRMPYVGNLDLYPDNFNPAGSSPGVTVKTYPSVNACDASGIIFNNPNAGDFKVENYNSLSPFVMLKYVLDTLGTAYQFGYEGDLYAHSDFQALLLWHTNVLDVLQEFIGAKQFIFIKREFNLNEFVLDLKSVDMLKELQKLFCTAVYYNERTGNMRMQMRKTIMTDLTYEDITEFVTPLAGWKDESLTGLRLEYKNETKDSFTRTRTDYFRELGVPEETIATQFSGLAGDATYQVNVANNTLTGPQVGQAALADFTPRLFFYKGYQSNGTYDYPKASALGQSFRLFWTGTDNMFDYFHKEYVRFLINRREVKYGVNFPLRVINNLNWERKYRIDRVDHYIKQITFTVSAAGVEPGEAEFYTTGLGAIPA